MVGEFSIITDLQEWIQKFWKGMRNVTVKVMGLIFEDTHSSPLQAEIFCIRERCVLVYEIDTPAFFSCAFAIIKKLGIFMYDIMTVLSYKDVRI